MIVDVRFFTGRVRFLWGGGRTDSESGQTEDSLTVRRANTYMIVLAIRVSEISRRLLFL